LRITPQSIEEVREAAQIAEVASEFTALRRVGARFSGLCPYPDHDEKTPSFSVSPDKNFYYCFGCSRGGDAIKLVMELKSFSFAEAVSHLAERFGVELRFEGRSPEEERAAKQRNARRRSAYKALAAATAYYHKYLLKSPAAEEARRYLKERGFERSTIEEFRLGYAPPRGRPGFVQAARGVGLGREALEVAGLISSRGGERFGDRVTFPTRSPNISTPPRPSYSTSAPYSTVFPRSPRRCAARRRPSSSRATRTYSCSTSRG
jgi:DNA primase